MQTDIATHPRIAELRARRKQLAERLLDVVEEARHIKEHINPALVHAYDANFRTLEITLQQKTLQAAEIGRREELFRLKIERGEKLNDKLIAFVHGVVDREFARVHKRLREAFDMDSKERERAARKRMKLAEDEGEVARMYRSIVKKLHPDLQTPQTAQAPSSQSPSNQASSSQYWQTVQDAYKNGNVQQLRTMYEIVCMADEQGDFTELASAEEYLRAEITRLARRVHSEETKLKNLQTSEPYTLKDNIDSEAWRAQETKRLEHDIAERERDIERSAAFLASVNAGDWEQGVDGRSNADKRAERAELFNDDFMENTYFGSR
jgi:hypothetical protein